MNPHERTAGDGAEVHQGLSRLGASPESDKIAAYFDAWAETYGRDLAEWSYDAPTVAAAMLGQEVPTDGKVLDAGCGTGLAGKALRDAGFVHVDGMDISPASLELARSSGAYEALQRVDMQRLPLPYDTGAFGGLVCVGVLSYVPDTDGIMREFCRIVRPGGVVVFTQRDDIFEERRCAAVFQALETEGVWRKISVSDPRPYLPENQEFGDRIRVIYGVYRVV
ncbi:MAG: methyltransferase domain-containing protein [Pseudomonadota bacterium]